MGKSAPAWPDIQLMKLYHSFYRPRFTLLPEPLAVRCRLTSSLEHAPADVPPRPPVDNWHVHLIAVGRLVQDVIFFVHCDKAGHV